MPKNKKRSDRIITHSKSKNVSKSMVNKFSVIESYKSLRTNIQFMIKTNKSNVLVFTSPLPKDGKSTVISNLGVAFAQTNKKVLIIDCDMRKPRTNKFFGVAATPGLSNFLGGLSSLEDVIQITKYANLSIISAGTIPPNPAELLSSEEMVNLIDNLRENYDLILLDTPPLLLVSDAYVTTKYSDGVVLIIKHNYTTYPMVEKCVKGLKIAKANFLGVVMNSYNYDKVYGKKYSNYGDYNYGNYGTYGTELEEVEEELQMIQRR